jgi:hypothetical protein
MKYPGLILADSIKGSHESACIIDKTGNKKWVAARPLPFYGGFIRRVKLAYGVFMGAYDALEWENQ